MTGAGSPRLPSLERLPLPDALAALEDWLKTAEFAAFVSGRSAGVQPVAVLPPDLQTALRTTARVVMLSQHTAPKQKKHPEINAAMYAWIQGILTDGEIHMDGDRHVVAAKVIGQWYVAVIKTTADRQELYLQSFRRSDAKNIARIRQRSALFRRE